MRNRSRKSPSPLSRSYESNGPDVKIRGTALHIAEKYAQLSRDAHSSGDRIMAENYSQHAEHYYRIVAAAQPQAIPRDDQGRDSRSEDPRIDDRGYAHDRDGDFDDDRDDDAPRINGHAARGNGAGGHPVRHLAEADQPDIVPPEHFERGGVDKVPVAKSAGPQPAGADQAALPADGGGDTPPPARTRRRRTPRPARSPRTPGGGDAETSESGASAAAASDSDTSAGDA